MRHRPEYINASAPYVRPALYVPPAPTLDDDAELPEVARQLENPVWRWARWVAVAVAIGALLGMFAYGVIAIADQASIPAAPGSSWVTPSTYGAPGPNGGPR